MKPTYNLICLLILGAAILETVTSSIGFAVTLSDKNRYRSSYCSVVDYPELLIKQCTWCPYIGRWTDS